MRNTLGSAVSVYLVTLGLLSGPAQAAVGTVSALEGASARTPGNGPSVPLARGSEIEVGDLLQVGTGQLKLTLNDGSVLMLGEGSELKVDEATFAGQERKAFSASLVLGALWAKVAKAVPGSMAKFEVVTERAVAGARGTEFQVEVREGEGGVRETFVGVIEGLVDVQPRLHALAAAHSGEALAKKAPLAEKAVARRAAEALGPGEAVTVRRAGIERGMFRSGRAEFERFIRTHRLERPRERKLERREDPRRRERERRR